jgi:mannose-1-phosphate guanylyltransferase
MKNLSIAFEATGIEPRWTSRTKDGIGTVHRWGVILAGGDGVRLRKLTRFVCGDDRPKQFCPLLGKRTLLQETRQRAERSIPTGKILYSLSRAHQDYYLDDLWDRPSQLVVQPGNKGTAPAILYTLLHLARKDPDAVVAFLPCDHYYSREAIFTGALESAFAIAEGRPEAVVLLGATPKGPEVEYGWIERGEIAGLHPDVFRVVKFHEKPPLSIAKRLLRAGSLWNTFVMVGHINAFLDMAEASVPALLRALRSEPVFSTSDGGQRIVERLYERIDSADFSRQVLSPGARRLLTLRLGEVGWNDLGDPNRVICALLESGVELPGWAVRWRSATQAARTTADRMSGAVA